MTGRSNWIVFVLLACSGCPRAANSQPGLMKPVEQCRTFVQHGQRREAQTCFDRLSKSPNVFDRAEGFWGLGDFDSANRSFRDAAQNPVNLAATKTEWGRLFSDRFNQGEAGKLFEEALTADPGYAPAYLELARVLSLNYDKR